VPREEARERPAKGGHGRIGLAVSPGRPGRRLRGRRGGQPGQRVLPLEGPGRELAEDERVHPGRDVLPGDLRRPKAVDRVYSMDVFMQVTEDGGKTFHNAGEKWKHVDNHAPGSTRTIPTTSSTETTGVYESWDRAATWEFKANLPVTRSTGWRSTTPCRSTTSTAAPRTTRRWRPGAHDHRRTASPTTSGSSPPGVNGFVSRIDPNDPNIVYSESQHGGLVRFDRRTGSRSTSSPSRGAGDPALRWNWILRSSSVRTLRHACTSPLRGCSGATIGQLVEGGEPRSDTADRPQQAEGHGPRVERGRGGQERLHVLLRHIVSLSGVAGEGKGFSIRGYPRPMGWCR